MKYENKTKYSACPNSEYQQNKKDEELRKLKRENKLLLEQRNELMDMASEAIALLNSNNISNKLDKRLKDFIMGEPTSQG